MKNIFVCRLLLLLCLSSFFSATYGAQKVKLADVTTLTFHPKKMTTARRGSPIPQAECQGSYCDHAPSAIQCRNVGSDGLDVQWKCDAELDERYSFGDISVSCEGYSHPEDPYILAGSCGLRYNLKLSDVGRRSSSSRHSANDYETNDYETDQSADYYPEREESPSPKRKRLHTPSSSTIGNVFIFIAVAAIVYAIWKLILNNSSGHSRNTQAEGSGYGGPGYGAGAGPGYTTGGYGEGQNAGTGGGGLFSTAGNFFGKYMNPSGYTSAAPGASSGPGFWSGAATGAGLGYLFGRRGGSSAASATTNARTSDASHTSRNTRPTVVRTEPKPRTRTATGFAGTERR